MDIPIQNIYYLLCYAWNKMREGSIVAVDTIESVTLLDLFANVLVNGVRYLLRRGLDRGYFEYCEDIARLRGKIGFTESFQQMCLAKPRLFCEYDEMNYDVLHNKIIKATIMRLIKYEYIELKTKNKLIETYRMLKDIGYLSLESRHFGLVQLHSNNYFYDFLLKICQLIHENLLISEEVGKSKFRDIIKDETSMGLLFEEFVRNFYKYEQHSYAVSREYIQWDALPLNIESDGKLPLMQTDVSLKSNERTIVIETKYYRETFQRHYDEDKIHSSHLFQLYSYLMNYDKKYPNVSKADGMLLYPTVHRDVDLTYDIEGHKVFIKTVNLGQEWTGIRSRLLDIIQ